MVVYDRRVSARVLRLARADAEKIDVGAAAPRPLDQDAISLLLVEKARDGKSVVRLKWGDPFVFDSGGKEALFLHEQGIPVRGHPRHSVRHRRARVRGHPGDVSGRRRRAHAGARPRVGERHAAEGRLGTPRRASTARSYATRARKQVGAIARALLEHGRSGDEAAALIYDGTTPAQQTVVATLATIAERARDKEAAMLIVGRVAGLREHLRWFDERPLFGRRIVVTRSREQAPELVEMLEDRGADAIQAPTIRIAPPEDPEALDRACAMAGSYDWLVFTSANAVDAFMRRLLALGDIRDLKGVRICAIGPSTAERISRHGIRIDLMPEESRAEAVIDAFKLAGDLTDQRDPAAARRHRARGDRRRAARGARRGHRGDRLPYPARGRRA